MNIIMGLNIDGSEVPSDMTTIEISQQDTKLNDDGYALDLDISTAEPVLNMPTAVTDFEDTTDNRTQSPLTQRPFSFPTILKLIINATRMNPFDSEDDDDDESTGPEGHKPNDTPHGPTMIDFLEKTKRKHGIKLDEKQLIAYQMICTSFMIKVIKDRAQTFVPQQHNRQLEKRIDDITKQLKQMGGKEQLIMFLTGPAGAGKTTAVKLAQKFCEKFSEACRIPFDQYSFFFTAYTGSAASDFGGITTLTALQIPLYEDISEPNQHTKTTLGKVKILIIDEVSFMTVKQLQKISKRLQELFRCATPFGGLSVIFSGDFRQLEQGKTTDKELLYTTHSGLYFENLLNSALILQNDHRFKEDPEFGKILTDMWFDDLSIEQKQELNKRVVMDKRMLPKLLEEDCFYACPTNIHRNIIHANNFRKHILATHR